MYHRQDSAAAGAAPSNKEMRKYGVCFATTPAQAAQEEANAKGRAIAEAAITVPELGQAPAGQPTTSNF